MLLFTVNLNNKVDCKMKWGLCKAFFLFKQLMHPKTNLMKYLSQCQGHPFPKGISSGWGGVLGPLACIGITWIHENKNTKLIVWLKKSTTFTAVIDEVVSDSTGKSQPLFG